MDDFKNFCFVCGRTVNAGEVSINAALNLPVCEKCKGTEDEKKKVEELLKGMADGFVCGCI